MSDVTLKDLAGRLGLSASTVSRALGEHPGISESTRARVRTLAKQLGYRPNLVAQSLQNQRTTIIGVIVPEIRHDYFASVISGVEEAAYQAGYAVMICQSQENAVREAEQLRALIAQRAAGILLSLSRETAAYGHLREALRTGTVLTLFDRVPAELDPGLSVDMAVTDDADGAYAVTAHLCAQGYARIAHLAGPPGISVSEGRKEGYLRALRERGRLARPEYLLDAGFTEADGESGMRALLDLPEPPDAVFAVNDPAAVGAFCVLRERGLRIPHDVALAGFSNNPVSGLLAPPLTTVDQNPVEVGCKAAGLLLSRLKGGLENIPGRVAVIRSELVIRASTLRAG